MRAKEEILEDLQVLEASMKYSDNPEYTFIHDCLMDELIDLINNETRVQFLDEVCALEGHIQKSIDPNFVVSFSKVRSVVAELRDACLPF